MKRFCLTGFFLLAAFSVSAADGPDVLSVHWQGDERERFVPIEAEQAADGILGAGLHARGIEVAMDGPDGGAPYHAEVRIESAGRTFVRSREGGNLAATPFAVTRMHLRVERCGEGGEVFFEGIVVIPADAASPDWPQRVGGALAEKIDGVLPDGFARRRDEPAP